MITIIHGADISSSRNFFLDLKQKESEQTIIDGKSITLTDLVQIFEGGELFSVQKNFYIENLLGKKKKSKELDQIGEYLQKVEKGNNIYIWEGSELTKTNLNAFKSPAIKLFKLPQSLFIFLENIKPGNGQTLIKLFNQSIQNADSEMVFFMMIRQVRMLLGIVERTNDEIDELKRMPPWQKSKLQNQADSFEINELVNLYGRLFEVEKAMKTGNLTSSLTETIDFLLLNI